MNIRSAAIALILATTLCGTHAMADKGCSTKTIAGKWIFATGIGRQSLGGPFPPGKDITALGTMNISRDGTISGVFDATIQDFFDFPLLGQTYTGTVIVNADCTGMLTFVNSQGVERTDSIAVVSRREILAMSRDPANLWTYTVRRIGAIGKRDRDDD